MVDNLAALRIESKCIVLDLLHLDFLYARASILTLMVAAFALYIQNGQLGSFELKTSL